MLVGSRIVSAFHSCVTQPTGTPLGAARRRDWRLLQAALVATDAVGLTVAVAAAGTLRLALDDVLPVASLVAMERHIIASILVIPLLLFLFKTQGLYNFDYILIGTREYARIAHASTYGVLIVLATSYLAGGGPLVSRPWVLLVWALSIGCVGLGRFTARRVVRWLRRHGTLRTRVVIVGASSAGVAIAEQLGAASNEGLDIVGFVDEYLPLGQALLPGLAVVGRPSDLIHGAKPALADEYILVPQAIPHERLEEIMRLMVADQSTAFRVAVTSSELLTHGMHLTERGGVPLLALRRARLVGLEAVLKRGLDIGGSTLALLLFAPLLVAVLARACLLGRWPLFHAQKVYGAGGRPTPLWLLAPAVTTWLPLRGVPALLAVLSGHLSLVGPRPTIWHPDVPPTPGLTAVKPGLTGPWRLRGTGASLADQAMDDLAYVRNYTIWEDVRILAQSLWRARSDGVGALLGRWEQRSPAPSPVPGDMSALPGSPWLPG